MSQKNKKSRGPKLRIIPLGGLGEIGKNLTVYEYEDDIIVVDIGSIFPREDMPGVDLVIPDVTYLEKNKDRIRGYAITHGHEDHIGAAPYILRDLPAPVYGTRLTLALVESKLKEHRLTGSVPLNVIKPGDTVEMKDGTSFTGSFHTVCEMFETAYNYYPETGITDSQRWDQP